MRDLWFAEVNQKSQSDQNHFFLFSIHLGEWINSWFWYLINMIQNSIWFLFILICDSIWFNSSSESWFASKSWFATNRNQIKPKIKGTWIMIHSFGIIQFVLTSVMTRVFQFVVIFYIILWDYSPLRAILTLPITGIIWRKLVTKNDKIYINTAPVPL